MCVNISTFELVLCLCSLREERLFIDLFRMES